MMCGSRTLYFTNENSERIRAVCNVCGQRVSFKKNVYSRKELSKIRASFVAPAYAQTAGNK